MYEIFTVLSRNIKLIEHLCSPSYPSNLPNIEICYKRLNFQFDVEARLWSFFLQQGGYHGFDGNEPGLLFLHFLFLKLSDIQHFFLNMAGFTDFKWRLNREGTFGPVFVVPLIHMANHKLLLLKIDCNFTFP